MSPTEKNQKIPLHNNTSEAQGKARESLRKLFRDRPFSDELLMTNFGLFMRSSAFAKLLFLQEAYSKILSIPGDICIFGVWLGQGIVAFESLRAILEPYNASRKFVGFDTFEGYAGIGDNDEPSDVISSTGYKTSDGYEHFLQEVLDYHRRENTMGHAVTHELVRGDVTTTVDKYFGNHPESIVALAYFDLALQEPTKASLNCIEDRLLPGSVIIMDELNDSRYPGETIAFRQWAKGKNYSIERSKILPDRSFITMG